MRLVFTLLLVFHAGLHVLGFLKAWKLASLPALSGRTLVDLSDSTSRTVGVLWLLATFVLLTAAALHALRSDLWWSIALGGVVLSQALVVFQWSDARAGTLANVVIAVAVVVAAATNHFKGRVSDEVRDLLATGARGDSSAVRLAELERLPAPVRRWLIRSGVVGKARVRTVRLKQDGEMRTGPEQPFMPARAEQYFSVDPPAFVWSVDVTMMRVLPVVGRDSYVQGRGHMLIEAMSLVTVVDASGETIDQGTLLRYLGEIVWFPSAALSPRIAWEPIDESRARATMSHRGVTASAVFAFDSHGRFTRLSARRYMGSAPRATLEDWHVAASDWRRTAGVEVPVRGNVIWKLSSGDFDYYRWEITELEFDPTTPYPHDASARVPSTRLLTPSNMPRSMTNPTGSTSDGP